jgi:hypothetical protein
MRGITHEGLIKKSATLLFDRFATRSLSEFLGFALLGVALSFLLMTLGYSALMDETSWAAVVGYIVMLNMVLKAFKSLFKLITEVTRMYPPISRLYEFNKKESLSPVSAIDELILDIPSSALTDKKESKFVLKKGEMAGISAPVSLTRYSIKFFDKLLTVRKKKKKKKKMVKVNLLHSAAIAVPISAIPVPVSLKDLMGLTDETGPDELKQAAGSMAGKIGKIFQLSPDTVIEQKDLNRLPEEALRYFSLMSSLVSDRSIIMAQSSLITEEWLAEFKDILKERIFIVCYQGLPEKPVSSKSAFKIFLAASADCTIAAAGTFSFINKRRKAINAMLKEREELLIAGSEKLIVLSGDDEDEDDE